VLVRAHPLHADRPARDPRQERGVRSGVFVAVVAIANLSSFPPGPELRSRPPEPESSPEEE